jgi:hypothetical protein
LLRGSEREIRMPLPSRFKQEFSAKEKARKHPKPHRSQSASPRRLHSRSQQD